MYFTLDHSPYLNRYGMVNPVHRVCVFFSLSVGHHVSSTYESHRLFVLSSFLSPRQPLLSSGRDAARCGGMAKYILVWRWTDKSFSIDRLKYKLRFQRFQRPPPHTRIRDNSSAFHRSLLSSKGVPRRFPHLKSVPSVCYYYYSCLFVTLF